MPSFKHNVAMIRHCPDLASVTALLKAHDLATFPTCGVADVEEKGTHVIALLAIASKAKVKRLDKETKKPVSVEVDKDNSYLFAIVPGADGIGWLEVYDGSTAALEAVSDFLNNDLASDMAVEPIAIDPVATFNKLVEVNGQGVLKAARIAGHKHSDNIVGPFSPRFANTQDGVSYIEHHTGDNEGVLKSVGCEFQLGKYKVKLKVAPNATISINTRAEAEEQARNTVRRLVGSKEIDLSPAAVGGAS